MSQQTRTRIRKSQRTQRAPKTLRLCHACGSLLRTPDEQSGGYCNECADALTLIEVTTAGKEFLAMKQTVTRLRVQLAKARRARA